jgi:hypothetical protein
MLKEPLIELINLEKNIHIKIYDGGKVEGLEDICTGFMFLSRVPVLIAQAMLSQPCSSPAKKDAVIASLDG